MIKTRDQNGDRCVERGNIRATPQGGGYWTITQRDENGEWKKPDTWNTITIARECLRLQMMPDEMRTREEFESWGFFFEETGGCCTAWSCNLGRGLWALLTDGEASAPLSMSEPCTLSLMSDEHGEPLKQKTFPSVLGFMAWLDGLMEMTIPERITAWASRKE